MHIESASAKNIFRCRRTSRMLNLKREANDRFAEVASSALRTLVGKDKHNFSGTEYDSRPAPFPDSMREPDTTSTASAVSGPQLS